MPPVNPVYPVVRVSAIVRDDERDRDKKRKKYKSNLKKSTNNSYEEVANNLTSDEIYVTSKPTNDEAYVTSKSTSNESYVTSKSTSNESYVTSKPTSNEAYVNRNLTNTNNMSNNPDEPTKEVSATNEQKNVKRITPVSSRYDKNAKEIIFMAVNYTNFIC